MQEDPAVEIALIPASSNSMGSQVICDCFVQRSCSIKLYALRTGRHGGQREQRGSRPSHDPLKKCVQIASYELAYSIARSTLSLVQERASCEHQSE